MDKKFIDILTRRFPSLTRSEIEQACLMAELQTGGGNNKLAFNMVRFSCLKRLRKEAQLAALFQSYDTPEFPEELMGVSESFVKHMEQQEEWETTLKGLPKPARMLARIATEESERFANEHTLLSVWSRRGLSEMRQRIKQRFISWHWWHSENAYYRARRSLVKVLNRNGRK